jgi:hypothetical protein
MMPVENVGVSILGCLEDQGDTVNFVGRNIDFSFDPDPYDSDDPLGDDQISPDLEAMIRDRLSKYAAQTVPPPAGVKPKAFVAIGSPDPLLKLVRGYFCICLGLKADVPGRMVIAAGNLISSTTFHACDRRLISLPLPQLDRFVFEIAANVHKFKGRVERGFISVSKHVLEFECQGPSRFVYATQKLYTGDRKYSMQINKQC